MFSSKGKRHFIGAMAITLLVAGCGGSSTAGEATSAGRRVTVGTGSLSKARFIKRADALCAVGVKRWEVEIAAYLKRYEREKSSGAHPHGSASEIVNTIFIPAYQEQIDRIRSLGAPSGDEKEVGSILTAMERALEEGREQPAKFLRSAHFFARASRPARAYGFRVCAEAT